MCNCALCWNKHLLLPPHRWLRLWNNSILWKNTSWSLQHHRPSFKNHSHAFALENKKSRTELKCADSFTLMFFQTYLGLSYQVKIYLRHLPAASLPYTRQVPTNTVQSSSPCKAERQRETETRAEQCRKDLLRVWRDQHCSALVHKHLHSQNHREMPLASWEQSSTPSYHKLLIFHISFLLQKQLVVPLKTTVEELHVNGRFLGYPLCYVGCTHVNALQTQCQ